MRKRKPGNEDKPTVYAVRLVDGDQLEQEPAMVAALRMKYQQPKGSVARLIARHLRETLTV